MSIIEKFLTNCFTLSSEFQDIFDVDYFIASLRNEVRILRRLPDEQKRRMKNSTIYSMESKRWSNVGYYYYKAHCFPISNHDVGLIHNCMRV
jgi:hypothetical protein